ncbi:hypothetical protein ACN9MH_11670 [Paenibacillus silvae]|uniref:hypothetical protein n=1 Tax=Paenibacillus TaxID=44249 RepID=UPI001C103169|nr:hypothetical protein [Paenibacillus barcinonensis]MBU5351096.1 hypothetical protein [Paenibacillus barcinonensis]
MKDILELLKNINKRIYLFFLFIVILLNFSIWKALKTNKEFIIKTSNLLLGSAWSFVFVTVLIISVLVLMKKSDRESNKYVHEHLFQPSKYETDGNIVNASFIKAYKNKGSNEIVGSIKVKINNLSEDKIDLIKGRVFFYKEKTRMKRMDFEIVDLNAGFSELIFFSHVNDDINYLMDWEFFELSIIELKRNQSVVTNKTYRSKTLYKSNYFILNIDKFIDYRILGIRLKYNLAWIKRKLRTKIIPRITFLYKRKTYYLNSKPPCLKELFALLQRFIAFTIVYTCVIFFIILIIYALYDIYSFINNMIKLWFPIVAAKI